MIVKWLSLFLEIFLALKYSVLSDLTYHSNFLLGSSNIVYVFSSCPSETKLKSQFYCLLVLWPCIRCLSLSASASSPVSRRNDSTYLTRLLWGQNELIFVQHSDMYLAYTLSAFKMLCNNFYSIASYLTGMSGRCFLIQLNDHILYWVSMFLFAYLNWFHHCEYICKIYKVIIIFNLWIDHLVFF